MQALLIEAESGGPNGRLYGDTLTTALAAHFVNHYSTASPLDFSSLKIIDRQRLGSVVDYIEAHLSEDIGLSDLALEAGLSKFHFSRLFKAATGLTPHKYLLKRRIEHAAQALQKRAMTLSEASYLFGFTDQSHFTRVFKQVKGMTPKQFVGIYPDTGSNSKASQQTEADFARIHARHTTGGKRL
ncbi:AraC family transcriptional regulator [Pseudanabaena sp. FACHB-2040]|uniref:AraC family transcriptional regulator n=1 Tax=Pseudanabaena sp. FACHB-2040 TaxID=2692859 RepID=UPI0016848F5E|nr:AraC family transcriptional regulator [Pseudanabaena sp. FACHB-2040]MBD2259330.1 helix-turn-helix transcriptional regulator [Pseudanabaena sp. FACHB-2040]